MGRTVRVGDQYLEFSGPLYDGKAVQLMKGAVAEGIKEIGQLGVTLLQGHIRANAFVASGRFVNSVEAEYIQTKPSAIGYVKVRPTDAWSGSVSVSRVRVKSTGQRGRLVRIDGQGGRPPRIWFERGTRGGARLRRAGYGFRKTQQALRAQSYARYFASRIERVLN